jgi:hypothetical protein
VGGLRVGAQSQTPTAPPPPGAVYQNVNGDPSSGIIVATLQWTHDGRFVLFGTGGFNRWKNYAYDLQSGLVVPIEREPTLIGLTPEQQEQFWAIESYAFASPVASTIVYRSRFEVNAGNNWPLRLGSIGNLETGAFLPMRTIIPEGSHIRWSDDGWAFVIEQGSGTGPYGFNLFHFRSKEGCFQPFCGFDEMWVGGVPGEYPLYDISPDGNRILFSQYVEQVGWRPRLWDVNHDVEYNSIIRPHHEGRILQSQNTIGAAFIRGDDEHILIVNTQGIVRYDLVTGETEIINPDINATWASWATFSPDNQWVAVLAGTGLARERLYVLPVVPE